MAQLINPKTFLTTSSVTLGDLMGNSPFVIPDYQRDYSWSEDELTQLWSDITRTLNVNYPAGTLISSPEPHFFGAIVTTDPNDTGSPEVIDGQQRLTTMSILLGVLLDKVSMITDAQAQQNVWSGLLGRVASTSGKKRYAKLTLAREHAFYDETVVQRTDRTDRAKYWGSVGALIPVQQRIKSATEFFYEAVDSLLAGASDPEECLIQLDEVVTELFFVLHLQVENHAVAYRVFETLNFRGLALSQADLVKNELIRRAENEGTRPAVAKAWETLVNELDRIDQVSLVEFLQYQYASTYGPVRASDLFETIAKALEQKTLAPTTYADELVAEAKRLVQVVDGDPAVWSGAANAALADIRDTFGHKFAYPLLMAAAAVHASSAADFDDWAVRTRNFVFRFVLIQGRTPDRLGSVTTEAARELRNKGDAAALQILQKESPDAVFAKAFEAAAVQSNKMGFYILKSIEDHISAGAGKTLDQSPSQHLEHIMPRKPGTGWPHVSNEPDYGDYVIRIGNLLVLEAAINKAIKNKSFTEKDTGCGGSNYRASKLDLPQTVHTYLDKGDWTFKSIDDRQVAMATTYANAIWHLK